MKIEIIIKEILSNVDRFNVQEMKESVKLGKKYKGIKLNSFEYLDLGSKYALPYDGIRFDGEM